jgi:hypothetical protein
VNTNIIGTKQDNYAACVEGLKSLATMLLDKGYNASYWTNHHMQRVYINLSDGLKHFVCIKETATGLSVYGLANVAEMVTYRCICDCVHTVNYQILQNRKTLHSFRQTHH